MFSAELYARISTNDQQALAAQNRAMLQYATQRGWIIALQVREKNYSAVRRAAREKLIEAARRRVRCAAGGGKLFGVTRIRLWGFRVFVWLCVSACWAAGAVRKPLGVYVHVEASDAIGSYSGKVALAIGVAYIPAKLLRGAVSRPGDCRNHVWRALGSDTAIERNRGEQFRLELPGRRLHSGNGGA